MIERALWTTWTEVWLVVVSAIVMILATIVYTRMAGLRSFSKMSSFDFAVTVAMGSTIGGVVVSLRSSLAAGVVALGALFATQAAIAYLRRRATWARMVDNRPLLLMAGSRMLDEHLTQARVTAEDVRAKLREANVLELDQVRAVVLETTGDISVLHGSAPLDGELLAGVRGAEALRS